MSDKPSRPREFTCIECGRDIVVSPSVHWFDIDLCAKCVLLPGWFHDPEMRKILDPSHDGQEMRHG